MHTPKNSEPIVFIIVITSIALYSIIRHKKLNYLGQKWKHHIVSPSMKPLKIKSKVDREVKRVLEH